MKFEATGMYPPTIFYCTRRVPLDTAPAVTSTIDSQESLGNVERFVVPVARMAAHRTTGARGGWRQDRGGTGWTRDRLRAFGTCVPLNFELRQPTRSGTAARLPEVGTPFMEKQKGTSDGCALLLAKSVYFLSCNLAYFLLSNFFEFLFEICKFFSEFCKPCLYHGSI